MISHSKTRTGFFFGVLAALVVIVAPAFVSAAPAIPQHVEITTQAEIIATVNLQDARITSQKDGVIGLSFDLANGRGIQTGVKYGVSLIKEVNKAQVIADTHVYPETLTLSANSVTHKDIVYTPAGTLNGTYQLVLEARTASGLPLGISMPGSITLAPISKGLEILPESCTGTETLTCKVKNYTSTTVSATPLFETHQGSLYGAIVAAQGGSTEPVVFNPNETKTITLTLPKASHPGQYEVAVALTTQAGKTNAVLAHYAVSGQSAAIANVILDKTSYRKDDTANLSLFWQSMGTTSPLTLTAMVSQGDTACATPSTKALSGIGKKESLVLPVTADCPNPTLTLSIKNAQGTILATTVINPNPSKSPAQNHPMPISPITIAGLIIALLLIGLLIFLRMKKQPASDVPTDMGDMAIKSLFAVIILSGGFFAGAGEARANTWTAGGAYANLYFYTTSTDKSTYSPNESVIVYGSVTIPAMGMFFNTGISVQQPGKSIVQIDPSATFGAGMLPNDWPWTSVVANGAVGNVAISAPGSSGPSHINLAGIAPFSNITYSSIPFTVAPACAANQGSSCNSSANSCNQINTGTIQCNGSCNASTPANPANLGNTCTSPANSCGQTNTGTIQCSGACSVTTPPDSGCLIPTVQIHFQ